MKRNGPRPRPPIERLLARIAVDPDTGCWIWQGYIHPRSGYGFMGIGSKLDGSRRLYPTHRVAYEAMVGPIPDRFDVDHLCRVRACCCPDHLEAVTHQENCRRGDCGKNNGHGDKTHCPHGHPYSGPNLTITKRGRRTCKACARERARRKKAAAL